MIVAGTGHRPDKLGGYHAAVAEQLATLACETLQLLKPVRVISGMALGWDTALAVAAHRLGVPFSAYVPFVGQESKWPRASQDSYHKLLKRAQCVEVIAPGGYSSAAMQQRNERMVDDCDLLLALWNGTPGGTANCVRYAERAERLTLNVWPLWAQGAG